MPQGFGALLAMEEPAHIEIHGHIYVVPRPLRFCASTFGAVCGKRHEKPCRFSFIFSSHHRENFTTSTDSKLQGAQEIQRLTKTSQPCPRQLFDSVGPLMSMLRLRDLPESHESTLLALLNLAVKDEMCTRSYSAQKSSIPLRNWRVHSDPTTKHASFPAYSSEIRLLLPKRESFATLSANPGFTPFYSGTALAFPSMLGCQEDNEAAWPVTVQQHWLMGEIQLRFVTILVGEKKGEHVQCDTAVTCKGIEGGELHVKEIASILPPVPSFPLDIWSHPHVYVLSHYVICSVLLELLPLGQA
ncbi:hypothetical protein FF1_000032 [Malus domestica]